MIRDHKSGPKPRSHGRKSNGLILLSAAFVGGVAFAVHRVDLQPVPKSGNAPESLVQQLPIPAKSRADAKSDRSDQEAAQADTTSVASTQAADAMDAWTYAPAPVRTIELAEVPLIAAIYENSGDTGAGRKAPPDEAGVTADDGSTQTALLTDSPNGILPGEETAAISAQALTPPARSKEVWTEYTVEPGDTLAGIFRDIGYGPGLLYRLTHSSEQAKQLAKIRPGQTLRLRRDAEDNLLELIHVRNRISSLQIIESDGSYITNELRKDVDTKIASVGGTITDSLFADGQAAGMSDAKIMELAKIFRWDIDFALEIRAGDRFSAIYEERFADGEKLADGPILAAEFVNRGTTYRAVRFTDKDGVAAYYDPNGKLKQRAFTRTPVDFARISSKFTSRRWHPVLKKWRSHKGVDYAAPIGTPVKATGAGRVSFVGRKGGFGKVIFIKHGDDYTTVYGHLSKFSKNLKIGSKVVQGQVIGRVGKTGVATGPHLHYEFRVNGRHRNPLTIKLPSAIALNKAQMPAFKRDSAPLLAQLDTASQQTMVATAFDNEG